MITPEGPIYRTIEEVSKKYPLTVEVINLATVPIDEAIIREVLEDILPNTPPYIPAFQGKENNEGDTKKIVTKEPLRPLRRSLVSLVNLVRRRSQVLRNPSLQSRTKHI